MAIDYSPRLVSHALTSLVLLVTFLWGVQDYRMKQAEQGSQAGWDSIKLPLMLAQCAFALFAFLYGRKHIHLRPFSSTATVEEIPADPYEAIEPRPDFDWKTTPPLRIWPFKPKYHLTMALETMPLSELIEIDNTFHDRLGMRKKIMDENPVETLACNPCAEPAVRELYHWLLATYLPKRYPTIYQIHRDEKAGPTLLDKTRQTHIPLTPPSPATSALRLLSENIDTDILLLLPSSTSPETGEFIYHLEAYTTTFPSGFSTRSKLGKPLAEIHAPVPRYAQKLEKSMDRFFAKLECGKCVKRANWAVMTDDRLFTPAGTHLYADDASKDDGGDASGHEDGSFAAQRAAVDPGKCRLRVERQTLHRLPRTGALVFAFKTYQYGLREVKDAGAGAELAEASLGLGKGSVPEIEFYKKGVVWGPKVREFLLG